MKTRELIAYSHKLLKGRRGCTMMVCVLPVAAELFFRFAEAAVYSLLLYFGGFKPVALFSGESIVQLSVALACSALRLVTAAPLECAAALRLCEICADDRRKRFTPLTEVLLSGRHFIRSISAALLVKLISLAALVPAAFFGAAAYELINRAKTAGGVFMAVHACVLTLVSVGGWISLKISLLAVPYLLMKYPEQGIFRTVLRSVRFMRGRKSPAVKLFAVYLLPTLTVIGLPLAVTGAATAFALCIDIYTKEDEYEEANIYSGHGKSHDPAKLPHRKKRRLKKAADAP